MNSKHILAFALAFLSWNLGQGQNLNSLKKSVESKVKVKSPSTLSEEEVAEGLKEALNIGVSKGVQQLSKTDGFYKDPQIKIPLPPEARDVEKKLRTIGQGEKVDEAIESINRAAEDAVIASKDIFVTAIKEMSLMDAIGILNGDKNAATKYLNESTRAQLSTSFKPSIKASLDKVGATKHWSTLFSIYNNLPMVRKVNPNLEDYATEKTLDGLFIQIAKEEMAIRKNPASRVTDLLRKVFQ